MEFNLADLFECVADTVPDRESVVCGDRRLTYAALDDRATRLAHVLRDRSVRAGDHVGCYMRNSIAHVETMLACYKLRAVPVNVNYRYLDRELAYLFDDADLVAVVHDEEYAPRVAAVEPECPRLTVRLVAGSRDLEDAITRASATRDFGPRSADDHYLLYTGGTTGLPKGVVWRQEDIFFAAMGGGNPGGPPIARPEEIAASIVDNPAQRLRPFLAPGEPGPDQFVSIALGPLMHASGQWSAFGTLLGGGRVVLYDEPSVDMTHVLDLVEREHVNALNLVGDASARPMLDALREQPGRWDTSSLRLLGSGGSVLSSDAKDGLMAELPNVAAIVEGIGSSESPAQAVALTTRAGAPTPSLTFAAKAETIVVDDDLRPIAPGAGISGRLATRGRVPIGYYKDPERSARTFVEIDGARWSLPGDMAIVDADGTIRLLGRGSMCINTGGEKVYPEEVEAALKEHRDVADAAVLGMPDTRFGERVVALVALRDDAAPVEPDALRDHCRPRLAGYKVPRVVQLVPEVVRTPAGKIDYGWARAAAAAPARAGSDDLVG